MNRYSLELLANGDFDLVFIDEDGERMGLTLSDSPEIRRNDPELGKVFEHLKKRLGEVDGAVESKHLARKLQRLAELEEKEQAREG